MIKILSFTISLSSASSITATPERMPIVNSFDHIGRLVGVARLPHEDNLHLKKRVLDAAVHPSGPTYRGVISSLSRDLGFITKPIFKIDLKVDAYGNQIAENPRVDIVANKVILYSSWTENAQVIDKEIPTYNPSDTGYYIQGLIDEINSSECFFCTDYETYRENGFSSCLINLSSMFLVSSNPMSVNKREILGFGNIVNGSITFNKKKAFKTEVASDPSNPGEYKIDYKEGIVTTFNFIEDGSSCSYYANRFPLQIDYSPVQLFSLNDDNFVDELYEKQTLDSGEQIRSILNKEGTDIYHTLYKQSASLWGE